MATLRDKIGLLTGLLAGDVARTGPFYATIDLTRRCNLHCVGCPYHSLELESAATPPDDQPDISLDVFARLCEQLRALGTREINLVGEGEPLMHPRFFDLVRAAKDAGLGVSSFTNGTLLDAAKIRALIHARLDTLVVSLWANSADEYALNYPGSSPRNFERIVNALKLFQRIKSEERADTPRITLHQPINRYNAEGIAARFDLAVETGVNKVSFAPFKNSSARFARAALDRAQVERLNSTLKEIKARLNARGIAHNIADVLLRYRLGEKIWKGLPCYIGWFHAHIKINGAVFACHNCDLAMGNLQTRALSEIWNDAAFRDFRKKMLTRAGMYARSESCDCSYCCYLPDNWRVHQIFKWFAPWMR